MHLLWWEAGAARVSSSAREGGLHMPLGGNAIATVGVTARGVTIGVDGAGVAVRTHRLQTVPYDGEIDCVAVDSTERGTRLVTVVARK